MNAALLLSRLHNVKRTGLGIWVACCPAHDDKHPSLQITEKQEGIVLIHCFAGCGAAEVLDAVGLEFSDLFPPKLPGGHRVPKVPSPFNPLDALTCLAADLFVVVQYANMIARGEALSPEQRTALLTITARFSAAESIVNA
jgi:hypothetical protein